MNKLSTWFLIHRNIRKYILTRHLSKHDVDMFKMAFFPTTHKLAGNMIVYAARHGYLKLFQWCYKQGQGRSYETTCAAAQHGHVEILDWLFARKKTTIPEACPLAACYGQLDVLKWAHLRQWDIPLQSTARSAARNGHLHVLQWLVEACGLQLWRDLYVSASHKEQLHILAWLKENNVEWDRAIASRVCASNKMSSIKWVLEHGCPFVVAKCLFEHQSQEVRAYLLALQ